GTQRGKRRGGLDESIDGTQRGERGGDLDDRRAATRDLWADLDAHIFGYLRSVTLADLVRRQTRPGGAEAPGVQEPRVPQGSDAPHSHEPATTV
ncbi:MAG: hypothetical protein ACREX6_03855, partial [Casimicrobiaceae bacterium]